MSLILFPQQRSSDNLIYLILPLGIALWLMAEFNVDFVNQQWLSFALVGVSVISLFLYMSTPMDILLRNILRFATRMRWKNRLLPAFSKWHELIMKWEKSDEVKEKTIKNMISNAVSSYPIRRRSLRIRAFLYFVLAYYFYNSAFLTFLSRVNQKPDWLQVFENWFPQLALLFIVFLLALFPFRRVYASHIFRDVAIVAEFAFATMMVKQHASSNPGKYMAGKEEWQTQRDLEYLDSVLLREDMDFFAIWWGNSMTRMPVEKKPENEPATEEVRSTCIHCNAVYTYILPVREITCQNCNKEYIYTET